MAINPLLVERIYEAAVLPELWPEVLEAITDAVGGFGATFIAQGPSGLTIMTTPRTEQIVSDYIAEGWANDPEHAAPLHADLYPGFRAETHYRTIEEIERLPVHVEFLAPRGLVAGVGTLLQGTHDDRIQMAVEGLPSHPAAEAAALWLDGLRAPLARALSLTARLADREAAQAVGTLAVAGIAAAIVTPDGRVRAVDDRFAARLGERMVARQAGLRFENPFVQARYTEALAISSAGGGACSVAVAAGDDRPALAIHILPLRRRARDVFGWDGILLLLAEPANAAIPRADLLRLLFDLTPSEARLTRHLVEGNTPVQAAQLLGIAEATARTHLRNIFNKTGVRRQSELVRLLLGLGLPD